MSQKGWWGVVALGLILGLVVGGVSGYVVGVNNGDQPSSQAIDGGGPIRRVPADISPSSPPTEQVSDADICNASDVYNALDIFGQERADAGVRFGADADTEGRQPV